MAAVDPLKYEVFYQKIDKVLNEAKEVLRYLSASMITREAGEVQEAFYLPSGEAVHISAGIFMHIMNVTRVIKYMKANRYDADDIGIYDGDQFINNDAYIGGMHCPDTAVVAPLFYAGKLLGYVAAISHTTETGAIEAGGMCPSSRESFHDGIHITAVKLIDRGKMRRDVLNMVLRGVRDTTAVELDIRARIAGNERALRRLLELVDEVTRNSPTAVLVQHWRDGFDRSFFVLERGCELDYHVLAIWCARDGSCVLLGLDHSGHLCA